MDNQIKAASIQGKYVLLAAIIAAIAAIIAAIIAGLFNLMSFNYYKKLLVDIDILSSEKNSLSIEILELTQQLDNNQKGYLDLKKQYNNLEYQNSELIEKYNGLYRQYENLLSKLNEEDFYEFSYIHNNLIKEEIWIDQLDTFYHEGKYKDGTASDGWYKIWDSNFQKDAIGNNHDHGIYIRGYRDDTYILEYILKDSYTGFKGIFTLEYESRNTRVESYLKVYSIDNNDEILLYSTPYSLYGGVEPINFDFPIYGVKHIRIEIFSESGDKGEFMLALVDACFYK